MHRQWTCTSDETRESERRLASQIASHVTASGNAENIAVRVVASTSLLSALKDSLPIGTDVKADIAAPLSATFDARVTVVAPESTATFELTRVGKVAPSAVTETETVTLDNGQVWAKTNLREVRDLPVFKDVGEFLKLTRDGKPACFETPSGDIMYNMHVELDLLCPLI